MLERLHSIKPAQNTIDFVRRLVQHDSSGHHGRRGDLTTASGGSCSAPPSATPCAATSVWWPGSPPATPSGSPPHRCIHPGLPELARLARTITAWQDQLLIHLTTSRASNGPTEAVSVPMKRIKRLELGSRNFASSQLRPILHCGTTWLTHRTTPIRGRSPRLVS
ncbi:MAG: transposase [Flavobacterium sp.]|nr:transposase [Aeromicrobium sp.]